MLRKSHVSLLVAIALLGLIVLSIPFTGCGGGATVKKEISPERQKAIQDSLFQLHKREVARLFSFGWEPFKQKDYTKAKRYFKQVAEIDTSGIYGKLLYQSLGTCYLQLGAPDSAEWAYLRGVENVPDDPYAYKTLGYIYRRSNRSEDAIEMYTKLTTLEPDSASNYKYLGELYNANGSVPEAIGAYQKAVELDPNDTEANTVLASLLRQQGDPDAVINQYLTIVEQDPENVKKHSDLADVYHQYGRFEKAIEKYNFVVSKEPQNIFALEKLGDSYTQIDNHAKAAETYKKIIEFRPDDKKNICNLSMSYSSMGRYTSALSQANKALRMDSGYGLAHIAKGFVYESAANRVVDNEKDGKIDFDDKLVYKLAYDAYNNAKSDPQWRSDASRRMSYLQTMIPTTEDKFMHKGQTLPNGESYSWIK